MDAVGPDQMVFRLDWEVPSDLTCLRYLLHVFVTAAPFKFLFLLSNAVKDCSEYVER